MFADDYLQMEVKTIKKKREKKMQAIKAGNAEQIGWWLKNCVLFNCVELYTMAW